MMGLLLHLMLFHSTGIDSGIGCGRLELNMGM